jgi:hypothetical protein
MLYPATFCKLGEGGELSSWKPQRPSRWEKRLRLSSCERSAEGSTRAAELVRAVEAQLDLERLLTYVAVNTLLRNGDSADELFLVGSPRGGEDQAGEEWIPERFRERERESGP